VIAPQQPYMPRTGVEHEHSYNDKHSRSHGSVTDERFSLLAPLIPFRNLTSNIEMGKACQGTEAFRIISQSRQPLTKRLNDPIERRKDAVVEVFFAQFVPNMFDYSRTTWTGACGRIPGGAQACFTWLMRPKQPSSWARVSTGRSSPASCVAIAASTSAGKFF
jgi:hypothetical protein